MNEFSDVRELLARIRISVGSRGLVGAAWDGELLRISHAMPETGKKMMIATFDGTNDYTTPQEGIIEQIAEMSRKHFDCAAPQSKEDAANAR